MKIIIAPDKFKGSLTSFEVCAAIEQGLQQLGIDADIFNFPLADGGDGFSPVMQFYQHTETIVCETVDPLNRQMIGTYQWSLKEKTAIIELAVASGIALLKQDELDPWITSTYGTGLLIKDAIHKGAKKIILGLGGSATNDGGTGILEALGFIFRDKNNIFINRLCGGQLSQITSFEKPTDLTGIEWVVCCDVNNPFYGPNGAAFVYGPQKGANEEQVKLLDDGLKNFAEVLLDHTGINIAEVPGAGAAGAVAGGLMAALNASLHQGIEMVLQTSKILAALDNTDLIITGEGKLDAQSLQGKVVGTVAALAREKSIPCIAICGRLDLSPEEIKNAGLTGAFSIESKGDSLEDCMKNAATYLTDTSIEMMNSFLNLNEQRNESKK